LYGLVIVCLESFLGFVAGDVHLFQQRESWKCKRVPGERDDQRGCGSFGILIGLLGLLGLLADAAADAAWGANPAGAKQLKSQCCGDPSSTKLIQVYQVRIKLSKHRLHSYRIHVFNHWFDMVWLSCSISFRPLNEYGPELWTCCGTATVLKATVSCPAILRVKKHCYAIAIHCYPLLVWLFWCADICSYCCRAKIVPGNSGHWEMMKWSIYIYRIYLGMSRPRPTHKVHIRSLNFSWTPTIHTVIYVI
jgi:hypothetical protein